MVANSALSERFVPIVSQQIKGKMESLLRNEPFSFGRRDGIILVSRSFRLSFDEDSNTQKHRQYETKRQKSENGGSVCRHNRWSIILATHRDYLSHLRRLGQVVQRISEFDSQLPHTKSLDTRSKDVRFGVFRPKQGIPCLIRFLETPSDTSRQ